MIRLRRLLVFIFVVVNIATLYCAKVHAQDYPNHPVKIVVPFPAGGPLDFTARLLGEALSTKLKQPFIVENRIGANGNVGTDAVAKAEPDGYTILMVLDPPLTVNPALYAKVHFDPVRDLAPIALIANFSQMLVVHPSLPVHSITDFVHYAGEHPVTYGSGGGKGSPGHLTMEYLCAQVGMKFLHVPYKGNPQVVADLVGGYVQAGFLATPSVVELVREGKLKGLAVSGNHRTPSAPDIPTIAEAGYPGFDVRFYQLMAVPAKTPESVRLLLEREVLNALRSSEIQSRLQQQDLEIVGANGAEARSWLHATTDKWNHLIRDTKMHIEE